jgi:hypothetical protein
MGVSTDKTSPAWMGFGGKKVLIALGTGENINGTKPPFERQIF